jgi:hypothetical protein
MRRAKAASHARQDGKMEVHPAMFMKTSKDTFRRFGTASRVLCGSRTGLEPKISIRREESIRENEGVSGYVYENKQGHFS